MPLPKPWRLPTPKILNREQADELYRRAFALADLKTNGLEDMVESNIRRYRMTDARISVYDSEGEDFADAELQIKQVNHQFNFGCNAFLADGFDSAEKNAEYERIFSELFNQAVIPFYWKDDEPSPGFWRFEKDAPFIYRRPPAEKMLEFCERTGCRPKGHNMLWASNAGVPEWLPQDKREAGILIEKRLHKLAERYAERVPMWDVTNEFAGANFTDERLPDDAAIRAWKLANELFFNDHLIINDYQCLFNDHYKGKMSAFYIQVQRLLDMGIRVDGIGMQCHLFHNEDCLCDDEPAKLSAQHMINMINTYSTLGRDIHISEITLPSYDGRQQYLELQDMLTENLYRLWFSMEKVKSIVWWNLVDGTAIKASPNAPFNENYFGGGLLKNDFTPKPALGTLQRLINQSWHTSISTHTDSRGNAAFCGFNGEYDITIKRGSNSVTKRISLDKQHPLITIKL